MNFKSDKTSLFILAATSLVLSRALFFLFNDPEGPNILVVAGMTAIVYFLTLVSYFSLRSLAGFKKFFLVIFIQIVIVTVFYLWLK